MGETLYLECYSGISGDMTVGALLDLGADEKVVKQGIESLGLEGFTLSVSRVKKSGLDACDFAVVLDAEHENHDHDMEYLHGHSHEEAHHHHGEEHHHSHEEAHHHHGEEHHHNHEEAHHHHHGEKHSHSHEKTHHHEHRGIHEIMEMIGQSGISEGAKKTAGDIFSVLAQAEAKAHGVEPSQVHFHEVGAVDSIVDIVAAAICLDNLNVERVIVQELYEGRGSICCQHGIIPVPVPAVLNITQQHGLPLHITKVQGELVTPTGAAIAAAVRTDDSLPGRFAVKKTGMGAGKRNYPTVGVLRAMLIKELN